MNVQTPEWVETDGFSTCNRRCPVCSADVYEKRVDSAVVWACANRRYNCPYDVDTR